MKIKVLLNPYANRWNARRRWPEADAALEAALEYSIHSGVLQILLG